MSETIRSKLGIKNNKKKLIELVDKKESFNEIFNNLTGKRILVAYGSQLSDSGEIIKGFFRGGPFKKIELYNSNQALSGFDGHIWFSGGGYAIGLSDVYDIAVLDEIGKENLSALTNNDLKIFKFEASAGTEEEKSCVIHANPFLAYSSLLKDRNIKSGEQYLQEIVDIAPGFSTYNYIQYRN